LERETRARLHFYTKCRPPIPSRLTTPESLKYGVITSWTQQADGNTPVVYGYGYDGADQLLRAVKTSSTGGAALDTYGYRYDPAGNRLGQQMAFSGTDFVTSSTYNDLNQVTNVSGTSGLQLAISGSLSEPGTVAIGSAVVSPAPTPPRPPEPSAST
jgi:hypothetical protein